MAAKARQRVEIWIHGVGGESPEQHLNSKHVRLVAGDDIGGFFEPADSLGNPIDETPRREALAWGGATSGTRGHALWILLLPFALVNIAGWSAAHRSPEPGSPEAPVRNRGPRPSPMVRTFGLLVTLSLVLYAATTMFDVVAIQCGQEPVCRDGWGFLQPLRWAWIVDQPTRALAVTSALPLLLLFGIDVAARRSTRGIEDFHPTHLRPTTEDALELSDPDFWRGEHPAARARALHMSAARALLAVVLAHSVATFVTGGGVALTLLATQVLGYAIIGVAAVLIADPITFGRASFRDAADESPVDPSLIRRHQVLLWLRIGSWVALGATVIAALAHTTSAAVVVDVLVGEDGPERFGAPYAFVTALALIEVVVGFALLRAKPKADEGADSPAFGGHVAFVACVTAAFLMVATAAGLHYQVANLLGEPVFGPVRGEGELVISWWYEIVALVLVVAVLAGIVELMRVRRLLRANTTADERAAAEAYVRRGGADPDPADRRQRERLDDVAKSSRWLDVIATADARVVRVVIIGVVTAVAGVVLRAIDVSGSGPVLGRDPDGSMFGFVTVGLMFVVSVLPLAAFGLLRRMYGDRHLRREVARVWDVATFWPRSVHPFAPPPYSERIVPQLRAHLDRRLNEGATVVLAGHSQGSVVSLAAVLSDPPLVAGDDDVDWSPALDRAWALNAQRGSLGLVTHGSPLRVMYARVFPAFFGSATFAAATARLASWHNFGTLTDMFAQPLFGDWPEAAGNCPVCGHPTRRSPRNPQDRVDWLIVDPEVWLAPEAPHPKIVGHSAYAAHQDFHAHVDRISASVARRRSG